MQVVRRTVIDCTQLVSLANHLRISCEWCNLCYEKWHYGKISQRSCQPCDTLLGMILQQLEGPKLCMIQSRTGGINEIPAEKCY